MTKINDGGLAFPGKRSQQVNMFVDSEGNTNPTYADCEYPGMTLRDWFAGQAVNGMMAADDATDWTPINAAKNAYAIADAMIEARAPSSPQTE